MTVSNLPMGWGYCQLGQVLTLVNGRAYKKNEMLDQGTPILRIQNLNGGNNWFYSDLILPEDKYSEKGDLLYAWSATFGPYWSRWDEKVIYHYHIWKIIPSAYMLKKFAYYELLRITDSLKASARGVAMPHITKEGMEKWPVLLPPLAEQQEIVRQLDVMLAQVEQIKARLDAIPAIIKKFRQSVLADAVSGKLTEEWRNKQSDIASWRFGELREFIEKPIYGTSAKSSKDGEVPVLRMGNLQHGEIDWADLVYTSDATEIKKYDLKLNDLLFNRTNSPELVGKTSIYRGNREAIFAGYLIRVRCSSTLDPEFLNYHLNSHIGREYCYRVKTDGVSQSNINAQKLLAYPLNCPSIDEQKIIVKLVKQYLGLVKRIEETVQSAQKRVNLLTQSILAKAFSGELTAEWREQHQGLITGVNSAESLLAKIKAEREASKPVKKTRAKKNA